MSMDEIIEHLLAGRDNTTRFTIPEGYMIWRKLQTNWSPGLMDREAFFKEIREGEFDYWFISGLEKEDNRLEGFCIQTYEIFADATEHDIIDKMLSQFNKVFTEEHKQRLKELELDIRDVIILASIIERRQWYPRPAGDSRSVLSQAGIGMPLQSCATVQYILGEQKPVLSIADTQIQSPYNTYIIKGLPPTPICSPGIESINAALWPAETRNISFSGKR